MPRVSRNRIIACLDVDKGKVVKGQKFQNVKEVADPLTLAKKYVKDGVDELVFYDITATSENRGLFTELISEIAKEVPIPFTVGGGIRTLEDIQTVLDAGADKVSLNSVVLGNPNFIKEAAEQFGREKIVFSMDVKEVMPSIWQVFSKGGRENTGIDAVEWAIQGEENGAGEIVLNSIDGDGEKNGYQIQLTKTIAEAVQIPVIASGGAGKMEHFKTALTDGKADGALAASVFHYNEIDIGALKKYLRN